MGRNKYITCPKCSKNIRSDNMKFHKHNGTKNYVMKTCSVCQKVMIRGNMSRHMKTHNISTKAIKGEIEKSRKEFEQLKETGQIIKEVIKSNDIDTRVLSRSYADALEINSEIPKTLGVLRDWQQKLLEYLSPSEREVIWVIGSEGNEGKSWFQRYLVSSFGSNRVFNCNIDKRDDGMLHVLSKQVVSVVDMFLFNIPKSFRYTDIPYTVLEEIKDGQSLSCKYNSKFLCFNIPNILAVFANDAPDYTKMSKDRWKMFTIRGNQLHMFEPKL